MSIVTTSIAGLVILAVLAYLVYTAGRHEAEIMKLRDRVEDLEILEGIDEFEEL